MSMFQPRRLRIVEKNLKNYSGPVGGVEFKDGVSVDVVDFPTSQRIGACMEIIDADSTDERALITPAAAVLRNRNLTTDSADVIAFNEGTAFDPERYASVVFHTQEELEDIASKGGLPAILSLAQRWGRKGRTIPACITAIMQEQDKAKAAKLQHDKLAFETPVEQAAEAEEAKQEEAKEAETVDAPETAGEDLAKEEVSSEEAE